ncbi:hypothetical protein [Limosilactobacillus reuteri]|nr:hypothetical protein [Limosilactobacillus reuteri]WLR79631.1 hypothetical protein Q3A95_10705 [Limosilactobacillus reuteri]
MLYKQFENGHLSWPRNSIFSQPYQLTDIRNPRGAIKRFYGDFFVSSQ